MKGMRQLRRMVYEAAREFVSRAENYRFDDATRCALLDSATRVHGACLSEDVDCGRITWKGRGIGHVVRRFTALASTQVRVAQTLTLDVPVASIEVTP